LPTRQSLHHLRQALKPQPHSEGTHVVHQGCLGRCAPTRYRPHPLWPESAATTGRARALLDQDDLRAPVTFPAPLPFRFSRLLPLRFNFFSAILLDSTMHLIPPGRLAEHPLARAWLRSSRAERCRERPPPSKARRLRPPLLVKLEGRGRQGGKDCSQLRLIGR
jgi:hypothetical protein